MSKITREIVKKFLEAFVIKSRRDRMHLITTSKKVRAKLCSRLAHKFIDDLDMRYVFEIANFPGEQNRRATDFLNRFYAKSPDGKCYIISEQKELDDKFLTIDEVGEELRDDMGTIVIVIPAHLAYYYGEEMKADYILFRE